MPLRLRRGTNAERLTITPIEGELIYTTDSRRLYVGDGNTVGGVDIVASTGGILTGILDLNTFGLTGVGTINITGSITNIGSISCSTFLSNGTLTLDASSITSSDNYISPETGNNVGILNLGSESDPLQIKKYWAESTEDSEQLYGITNGISALINAKYTSRGSLTTPLTVNAGDALSYDKVFGYDGFDYVMSSGIWQGVDPYATPAPGQIPGAIALVTEGINGQNVAAIDSRGYLSVNKFPAAALEALDVNGNGLFSGFVSAGAFIGDVYAQDSTLLVNSTTGELSSTILSSITVNTDNVNATDVNAGSLNFNSNIISSNTTYISGLGNTVGILELGLNHQIRRFWEEPTDSFDLIYGISNGGTSLVTSLHSSRGTIAVPTALQPSDTISIQNNYGFDGLGFSLSSAIKFDVDPNGSVFPGSVPGTIKLMTSNGIGLFEGLVVNKDGYVGIRPGLNTIAEPLDVFGNGQIRGKIILKQDLVGFDVITSYGISSGFTSILSSNYSSRGTISNPTQINPGDTLSGIVNYGYDGSNYSLSSLVIFGHDIPVPVAPGVVPGKIQFFTNGTLGINPSSGFDSLGRFGVRNGGQSISEALEVYGNTKVIGKTIIKQDIPGFDISTNYGITNGYISMTTSNFCSRGTTDSPTALNPGDIISGTVNFGYDGSNYVLSSLITFGHDTNVPITPGSVPGEIQFFTAGTLGINLSSGFDSNGYFGIRNAGNPLSEALDVNGNAVIRGDITAAAFKGSLVADDSTVVVNGMNGNIYGNQITAASFKGTFVGDDSTLIIDGADGSVTGSTVTSTGFVMFGSYDAAAKATLTPANGMVIYNTTDNRFQGFQNGAWINLDDGTAAP